MTLHFAGDPDKLEEFIFKITEWQNVFHWSDDATVSYALSLLEYPATIVEIYTSLGVVPNTTQKLFDALRRMFKKTENPTEIIDANPKNLNISSNPHQNINSSHTSENSTSQNINSSHTSENSTSQNINSSHTSENSTYHSLYSCHSTSKPNCMISIELIGPFPDNFHILSIFNYTSCHLQLIPIRSISCYNITKKINKYISIHGGISYIHTDIWQLNKSKHFAEFTAQFNIKCVQSFALHPNTFNISQQIQWLIYHTIIALTQDDQEWFRAVNILMMLFNSNFKSTFHLRPHYNNYRNRHHQPNFNKIFFQFKLQLQNIFTQISNNLILYHIVTSSYNKSPSQSFQERSNLYRSSKRSQSHKIMKNIFPSKNSIAQVNNSNQSLKIPDTYKSESNSSILNSSFAHSSIISIDHPISTPVPFISSSSISLEESTKSLPDNQSSPVSNVVRSPNSSTSFPTSDHINSSPILAQHPTCSSKLNDSNLHIVETSPIIKNSPWKKHSNSNKKKNKKKKRKK